MTKQYDASISAEEIAAIQAREIDFSDLPELGDDFWDNARVIMPDRTQSVTLRIRQSVLDAFKADGKGYQTRMNAVLESYVLTTARKASRAKAAPKRAAAKPGGD